jgi:uncharacterized protein (TIGR02246 family)
MGLDDQDGISNRANQPIESLLREIEAAWNRGDLLAYAGLYAKNAGYVSRAGKLLTGRTEIEELPARLSRKSRWRSKPAELNF